MMRDGMTQDYSDSTAQDKGNRRRVGDRRPNKANNDALLAVNTNPGHTCF